MKIEVGKDRDGYTAKVAGRKDLFAFGYSRREAVEELVAMAGDVLESEQEVQQLEKRAVELLHKLENEG